MYFLADSKVKIVGTFERLTEEASTKKLIQRLKTDFEANGMALLSVGEVSFEQEKHEKKAIVDNEFVIEELIFVKPTCFANVNFAIEAHNYNEALSCAQKAINAATNGLELLNLSVDAIKKDAVRKRKIWRNLGCGGIGAFEQASI